MPGGKFAITPLRQADKSIKPLSPPLPPLVTMSNRVRKEDVSPPSSKRRRLANTVEFAPTLPLRPLQPLAPEHFRVFTWNVNGIKPFLQPSIKQFFKASRTRTPSPGSPAAQISPSSYSLRGCLERWQWPHVLCLQEVKINNGDEATQKAVQQAVKAVKDSSSPSYRAFFSLPRDKVNAGGFGGKLYGVCTLVREDVFKVKEDVPNVVSVESVDWDREGRVLVMRIPERKLFIINVYAVNGTDYPYKDNSGQVIGTRHDFKRKFHTLLQDAVQSYQQQGWSVVVAGDINISRDAIDGFPGIRLAPAHVENRQDFDKKFIKPAMDGGGLGMVDSFRRLHQGERKYTYRSPNIQWGLSCDRVDLILLTADILGTLKEADILDAKAERGPSDHLPAFVTLDLAALSKPPVGIPEIAGEEPAPAEVAVETRSES